MPERTIGAVSKTAVVFMATVGSNPTPSAWAVFCPLYLWIASYIQHQRRPDERSFLRT